MIKHNLGRTDAYRFTTDSRDDSHVVALREEVKAYNATRREGQKALYVKLQGRGHRYGNRRWNQALPLDYAERYDVYTYERKDWWRK